MKMWRLVCTAGLAIVLLTLSASATLAQGSRAARAEVRFLQGMIDHHQMALDMAEDCLAKAEAEVVRTLCQNVINAQSAEITMMQTWLADWFGIEYAPMPLAQMLETMAGSSGHAGHAMQADPPMTMGMMAGLNRLSGREYDIAWLEAMIDHHDDALHMARRVLARAEHDALVALAVVIIRDQNAEISLMETLIAELVTE